MNVFYGELAPWWPLVDPVESYEDEAAELERVITERAPASRTLLELGSGGGNNAFFLKRRFVMTLSDLSRAMLDVSAALNPDCEHVEGDLRTLDLGRTFDVVLAHDAIDYMVTEADLDAALSTASRHLRPGGLALFAPDHVAERYEASTDCGGTDGPDGRSLRYLEWNTALEPGATRGVTHYSFLVGEADGSVRCLHEAHEFGVFPQQAWLEAFDRAGFDAEPVEELTGDDRVPRLFFVGRKR